MISSVLQGGLGNQLFQIATASSVAKDLNVLAVFSTSLQILNLQGNRANTYKNNIFSRINLIENNSFFSSLEMYKEPSFSFKELPKKDNLLLNGYFQSEKYFFYNREYIKQLFSETEEITNYIDSKYYDINFNNSISLHVRRGDYLRFPNVHPVCDLSYYDSALQKIYNYENILVFSDDMKWCKNNLKYDNLIFIENENDYIDFYLISRCRNNIIANSSFSWWAAWMNANINKKVIYPSRWFGPGGPQDTQDLHPKEWIKCY